MGGIILEFAVTLHLEMQSIMFTDMLLHLMWGSLGISLAQSTVFHGIDNCVVPGEHVRGLQ